MSNFFVKVLGNLAGSSGVNSYNVLNSTYTTVNSDATTTDSSTPSFSLVLNQLNNNLDTAVARTSMNSSYGYTTAYNTYNPVTTTQQTQTTMMTPNISAIANMIKRNKDSVADVDSQVREYLLSNYGGSVTEVIKNLSGVQNLPSQAVMMQDMLFNQIVSKISTQVRDKIYDNYSTTDISNFSDDESSDSSSSTSSVSSSDFDYGLYE